MENLGMAFLMAILIFLATFFMPTLILIPNLDLATLVLSLLKAALALAARAELNLTPLFIAAFMLVLNLSMLVLSFNIAALEALEPFLKAILALAFIFFMARVTDFFIFK